MTDTAPVADKGEGWVVMHHPKLPNSHTEVTEQAFTEQWEPNGWKRATKNSLAKATEGGEA